MLIDEDPETEEAVNAVGHRFFTDPEKLKEYVKSHIQAEYQEGLAA